MGLFKSIKEEVQFFKRLLTKDAEIAQWEAAFKQMEGAVNRKEAQIELLQTKLRDEQERSAKATQELENMKNMLHQQFGRTRNAIRGLHDLFQYANGQQLL